ncbi:MAG TPA: CPBP family glutamic-type intramembrane protease [Holophagaceae bacterium]|nr:CPBP family glutamic-type intramembrane protease [Holophagaceae bacterium]
MPFWVPALWIGGTLALLPHLPWVTLLGYHALCLQAALRHPRPRLGRMPGWILLPVTATALAVPWILHRPGPALPMAGAQTFLAHWPGGFLSYVGYTLTVNSLCEEAYWRHALPLDRPHWTDLQHGAAFGLHHVVANGLVFGWVAAPLAFVYTALGGLAARATTRWSGGLGVVMLGHSLLNALSFAWLWGRLH